MLELSEVKKYLRVTENLEDQLIQEMVKAAKCFAENMLGYKLDDKFKTKIPEDIKFAIYIHVASIFDNRGTASCPNESLNVYKIYRKHNL